jgi:hypothetical protein
MLTGPCPERDIGRELYLSHNTVAQPYEVDLPQARRVVSVRGDSQARSAGLI